MSAARQRKKDYVREGEETEETDRSEGSPAGHVPRVGCKLREAHIHLWEPGFEGLERGRSTWQAGMGACAEGGLGRGMAIQCLVQGLEG